MVKATVAWHPSKRGMTNKGMGYGIAIVAAIVVIVLLLALNKRPGGASSATPGHKSQTPHGITVEGPSSDQPTPRADRTVNKISTDKAQNLPPG